MEKKKTGRGFQFYEFNDRYGAKCTLQKSSIAYEEECIWLGVHDVKPRIMAQDTAEGGDGWVNCVIPPEVFIATRMHLSRTQVKELLPILKKFVKTGEV